MQEDIDHRAVALVINTTKMTGRALKSASWTVAGRGWNIRSSMTRCWRTRA